MTPTTPLTESEAHAAGLDCIRQIREHYSSRPKGTGLKSLNYRPSDVVVTTFPKSGTTLMQHIAYQVVALSGGGPDFDRSGLDFPDLSVVAPWLDYIPQIGLPPCESSPRLFKTHSPVSDFPSQAHRHIVVVRDPTQYPSSWLDFVFDATVADAAIVPIEVREATFHACVEKDLLTPVDEDDERALGRWHEFVDKSVLPVRENILIMFYESILEDFAGAVRKVAAFMGCELTDSAVEQVVARCSRKAMAGDPRFSCKIENKRFGLSAAQPKAKLARSDGFKRFSVKEEHVRLLEEMNMRAFGLKTYNEFRQMVSKQQWDLFRR